MICTNFAIDAVVTQKHWVTEGRLDCEKVAETLRQKTDFKSSMGQDAFLELLGRYRLAFGAAKQGDREVIRRYLQVAEYLPQQPVYIPDDAQRRNGDLVFEDITIYSARDYLYYLAMWGKDSVIAGYPDVAGNGMALVPINCYAICSKSEHKELAWKYLESFYTDLWQQEHITSDWCFPVCKERLEQQFAQILEEQLYKDEDGRWNPVPLFDYESNGERINVYASEEDFQKIREMIAGLEVVQRADKVAGKILTEEAGAYFAGDKSMEEAIDIMENRLRLWRDE